MHIANSIAALVELNTHELDNAPRIHDIAWELTGLDQDVIAPTIADVQTQISGARALLMGS
ncbi:MAG: hypothetical protein GXP18_04035 [Gammaproteobacteria bacterium]|nr:hypothetical protein [Gammaproteobacteria bacterium]